MHGNDRSEAIKRSLYRTRFCRSWCRSWLVDLTTHDRADASANSRRAVSRAIPVSPSAGGPSRVTSSGADHQPALQHHVTAARDADRHTGSARIDREQERYPP